MRTRSALRDVGVVGIVVAVFVVTVPAAASSLEGWPVRYERHYRPYEPLPWDPRTIEYGPARHEVPDILAEWMRALGAEPHYPPIPEQDILRILATYYVVPADQWAAPHDAFAVDRVSWVAVDGSSFHLIHRTGGFAAIVYSDGGVIYLTRDLTKFMGRASEGSPSGAVSAR